MQKRMDKVAEGFGIDVLVNNAGTTIVQKVEAISLDVWERTLRVNLTATLLLLPRGDSAPAQATRNRDRQHLVQLGAGWRGRRCSLRGFQGRGLTA